MSSPESSRAPAATGALAGDEASWDPESQDLSLLREALLRAWGPDTCAPEDQPAWHPGNPARGQCITTVLVVHDELGGTLVRGEVRIDGEPVDYHWWNRLPDGRELDFTRQQFAPHEVVTGHSLVTRPADGGRVVKQYELLRSRVDELMR